jgi:hypothetical protein
VGPGAGADGAELLNMTAALAPYLGPIWRKIKTEVYYHPELLISRQDGVVQMQIRVDRWGQLTFLNESTMAGPAALRGWVAQGVTEALSAPILNHPMAQPAELVLKFQFTISSSPPPMAEVDANGNTLYFAIRGYIPPLLPSGQKLSRGKNGEIILHRERWDFFEKLKMYVEACDLRRAEGGCARAAELYGKLNQKDQVRKYKLKACHLGLTEFCE